jgi:hypothetical protein
MSLSVGSNSMKAGVLFAAAVYIRCAIYSRGGQGILFRFGQRWQAGVSLNFYRRFCCSKSFIGACSLELVHSNFFTA